MHDTNLIASASILVVDDDPVVRSLMRDVERWLLRSSKPAMGWKVSAL